MKIYIELKNEFVFFCIIMRELSKYVRCNERDLFHPCEMECTSLCIRSIMCCLVVSGDQFWDLKNGHIRLPMKRLVRIQPTGCMWRVKYISSRREIAVRHYSFETLMQKIYIWFHERMLLSEFEYIESDNPFD